MKSFLKIALIGLALISLFSTCKKKDERICPNGNCTLSFDRDSIFFDTTVFTGVKTISKRLTVYNNNKYAIQIKEISVPTNSPFKLIINGERTNTLTDVKLRGNDKMLIIVEAIFNENEAGEDSIQIVEENLKFVTDDELSYVRLIAPTLNVYFHNAEELDCDAVWKSDYPHLIYNSVLVPRNCTLTIEAGASIFSHSRSAILVNGNIQAIGTKEKPIIFTDDRVDNPELYDDIFGIWEGILILPGSSNNKFDWVRINNAVNGIRVNYFNKYDVNSNGQLVIDNEFNTDMSGGDIELEFAHGIINTIGNNVNAPSFTGALPFSGIGIIGRNCDIDVHNSLITNCTVGSMMVLLNGQYRIINCTFTNYPYANASFSRPKDVRTFYASTILADASGVVEGGQMDLTMVNTIIYGENSETEPEDNLDELTISQTDQYQFKSIGMSNNIIKTKEFEELLQDFNILNEDPFPSDVTTREDYDFSLESESIAIDEGFDGQINIFTDVEIDLNGEVRSDPFWDIGAYEYFPE